MNWRERLALAEKKRIASAADRRLRRTEPSREETGSVTFDGLPLLDFCSNDYLGFSLRPELALAAEQAARRDGTGARASRLIAGNYPLLEELESALSNFKQTTTATIFPSGYQANLSLLAVLLGKEDAVFVDRLAHACLIDGVRLSGARLAVFPHNDLERLEALLVRSQQAANRWIIVDGVYSMDGDLAPLPLLLKLAEKHDATIILDDAHGTGTIGLQGRGTASHFSIKPREHEDRLIITATLSKALGSQGGAVVGSSLLRRSLINSARGFIYSTGLNPPAAAAALASIRLLESGDRAVETLHENIRRFHSNLVSLAVAPHQGETPIFPVVLGTAEAALRGSEFLRSQGIAAVAIRPPTVPEGSSRIRFTVTAAQSAEGVDSCCTGIGKLIRSTN